MGRPRRISGSVLGRFSSLAGSDEPPPPAVVVRGGTTAAGCISWPRSMLIHPSGKAISRWRLQQKEGVFHEQRSLPSTRPAFYHSDRTAQRGGDTEEPPAP